MEAPRVYKRDNAGRERINSGYRAIPAEIDPLSRKVQYLGFFSLPTVGGPDGLELVMASR